MVVRFSILISSGLLSCVAGIMMIATPAHMSNILQPIEMTAFGILQYYLQDLFIAIIVSWMH